MKGLWALSIVTKTLHIIAQSVIGSTICLRFFGTVFNLELLLRVLYKVKSGLTVSPLGA